MISPRPRFRRYRSSLGLLALFAALGGLVAIGLAIEPQASSEGARDATVHDATLPEPP